MSFWWTFIVSARSWLQGFGYCCEVLKALLGGAEYFFPLLDYIGRHLEDFIDIAGCWYPSAVVIKDLNQLFLVNVVKNLIAMIQTRSYSGMYLRKFFTSSLFTYPKAACYNMTGTIFTGRYFSLAHPKATVLPTLSHCCCPKSCLRKNTLKAFPVVQNSRDSLSQLLHHHTPSQVFHLAVPAFCKQPIFSSLSHLMAWFEW